MSLISPDLISSELNDCEATQFAVAATNQNAVGGATVNSVTILVSCDMAKTGYYPIE